MHPSNRPHANNRLRQERLARNWRQRDLANQLGTTVVSVTRWERGIQQPDTYFRTKLCALFGKSAEDLGLLDASALPQVSKPGNDSQTGSDLSNPAEVAGIWVVPYRRNPHFTGREELLEQLAWHLTPELREPMTVTRQAVLGQPWAIRGLSGIGKTQIALEYAYRARQQGRSTHTFWINATNDETVLTSFQAMAAQLPDFTARDEPNQHKLIAAILHWLQKCQEPWLLIVDNADDLALVRPYLPQLGQGSILLTTRAHAVRRLANTLEVEQMGLVEGAQFLLHRTWYLNASDEEYNEACNIVIALDGFPLALDQAGACIEEIGCSFGDYLQLYEQHRARLLARRGMQATCYPASVATTWDLSLQKAEQAHHAAAELLRLCAFLSPDHIPEELLTETAEQWPPALQQAVANQFTFNELIKTLLAFSLVRRQAQEHLLSVHRLVQAVQMDRMELEEQRIWAERVVRAVHMLFPVDPKGEVATWPQCLRYLEQVQVCDSLIQQHLLQLPEAAELLGRAGIYLREHASYDLAEPLFERALVIAEQHWGSEHLQVATLLSDLSILYGQQGKYERAEPLLLRAVQIAEKSQGPSHPQLIYSLNHLGELYRKQGKYERAEPLYLRALQIAEQALDPSHSLVARSLDELGSLFREQGRYEQADACYQRALSLRQQSLGSEHPEVAETLYFL